MAPYTEPEWAEVPSEEYHFEIIKQGILVGKSLASKKSFLVAGILELIQEDYQIAIW
jgi:hypothetical protein